MPTSKDVAEAAGVAQSTVSYVLSGKRPISEKTRKKVEAAIEQLTYQPNAGARALASRKTRVIGLVIPFIPELEMASIMEFVSVIASTARQYDHDILLVTEDEGAAGLRRVVGQQICDGLILMQVEDEDERLPVARTLNVPVLLIGIPRDPSGLVCIDADFEMAGEHCVRDLAAAGHSVISIIDWQPAVVNRHVNYVDRFMGGADAAANALGVTVQHLPGGPDQATIADSVDKALAATRRRTGVHRARPHRPGHPPPCPGVPGPHPRGERLHYRKRHPHAGRAPAHPALHHRPAARGSLPPGRENHLPASPNRLPGTTRIPGVGTHGHNAPCQHAPPTPRRLATSSLPKLFI